MLFKMWQFYNGLIIMDRDIIVVDVKFSWVFFTQLRVMQGPNEKHRYLIFFLSLLFRRCLCRKL